MVDQAERFDLLCGKGRGAYEEFMENTTLSPLLSTGCLAIKDTPAVFFDFFRKIYAEKALLESSEEYRIPRIIHQIWLGTNPKPPKFEEWQRSIVAHHPDWQYILWTDADLAQLPLVNRELYSKATNLGEKADILRLELLAIFGGVYLDIDCEVMQPLDLLHKTFDFYAALRPIRDGNYTAVMNGMVAACPRHPLIERAIACMKLSQYDDGVLMRTGPPFLTKVIYAYPSLLSPYSIVLPPVYLSPFSNPDNKYQFSATDTIMPETFIVHHWSASWVK